MRIVRAHVLEFSRELDGRSWNPLSRWTHRRAPLLILETDHGIRGHAEAWSRQDEIDRVLDALGRFARSHVLGRSFDDADAVAALHESLHRGEWPERAAASAIDMALWDLLGRSRRQPLWSMLGGSAGEVRVYASGGLYRDGCGVVDLAREVARYQREGFRDVKIKVAGLPLPDDIERIGAVRSTMAVDAVLWVDAVNRLDAGNALEHAAAYRDAGANAIQAPVAFDDVATMARIGAVAMPVIAGESTSSADGFMRLLDAARVGYAQVNLGLCGGFTGADRIAAIAASRGVPVTVQAHGTAVLLDASLHWGAARNVHSVEFHRFHDHLQPMFATSWGRVRDGIVSLPPIAAPASPLLSRTVPHGALTLVQSINGSS